MEGGAPAEGQLGKGGGKEEKGQGGIKKVHKKR